MTGEEAIKAVYVWHATQSQTLQIAAKVGLVEAIQVCTLGVRKTEICVIRNIGENHAYQVRADRLFKTEIEAIDCLIKDTNLIVADLESKISHHQSEIEYLVLRRQTFLAANNTPAVKDDPSEYVEGLEPVAVKSPDDDDAGKTVELRK